MITALGHTALAHQASLTSLQGHTFHHDGWGPGFPFFLIPLFFWAFFLIFFVGRRRSWYSPERSAEQVLAENFARGEVSEEQYRERRAVLRESRRFRR
jgi:putative membrane protein